MRDRCCGLEDEPRLWLVSFNWSNVPFALGSALSYPLSSPLLSTLIQHSIPSAHPLPKAGQAGHQAQLAALAPAETAGPALLCYLQSQPVELKVMPWSSEAITTSVAECLWRLSLLILFLAI